jgi:hypothetical protein
MEMIRMLSAWKHSGFHVFCGNRISPTDATAMENLARYMIRASFSQERMQSLDQEGKVIYTTKDKKTADSIYPFHDHGHRTPYFVVKTQLTHKIILHILPP